jgi:hypothetical protein
MIESGLSFFKPASMTLRQRETNWLFIGHGSQLFHQSHYWHHYLWSACSPVVFTFLDVTNSWDQHGFLMVRRLLVVKQKMPMLSLSKTLLRYWLSWWGSYERTCFLEGTLTSGLPSWTWTVLRCSKCLELSFSNLLRSAKKTSCGFYLNLITSKWDLIQECFTKQFPGRWIRSPKQRFHWQQNVTQPNLNLCTTHHNLRRDSAVKLKLLPTSGRHTSERSSSLTMTSVISISWTKKHIWKCLRIIHCCLKDQIW